MLLFQIGVPDVQVGRKKAFRFTIVVDQIRDLIYNYFLRGEQGALSPEERKFQVAFVLFGKLIKLVNRWIDLAPLKGPLLRIRQIVFFRTRIWIDIVNQIFIDSLHRGSL